MLKNKNIICISSIDWDFVWQGHQEIMATFARNGNRVLFIENTGVRSPNLSDVSRILKRVKNWFKSVKGFKEVEKNLYVFSPLFFPFPYSCVARFFNNLLFMRTLKKWIKINKFTESIIWTFLPTKTALNIIEAIDSKLIVYYCIADFNELVKNRKSLQKNERNLLKKCDVVFAQGEELKKKCSEYNKNVSIFPFGVNLENFLNKKDVGNKNISSELNSISRPIIGYSGGIHRHINFELLKELISRNKNWSFVFVGPIQTKIDHIKSYKNVYFLGQKEFYELPDFIACFDACIIPYRISKYTDTVYPTKLNEYFAMGKPVVSTPLPEIKDFSKRNGDAVFLASTVEEYEEKVKKALRENNEEKKNERIDIAKKYSWDKIIEDMSHIIEETLDKKDSEEINWQKQLQSIYKKTRRKIFGFTASLALFWILLFHTSLPWWLAKPLLISAPPEKADAIVVLAGGVGESGKAGQGYEERVEYAARLYKKGYAKNLIFSSGYVYQFKEPEVMRALAVSLGVPEDDIVLEEKASSTYLNVEYVNQILEQKKWKKIIIISSPFHMRRVSLVFDKIADNVEVVYSPIPFSRYYNWPRKLSVISIHKQIRLKQIRGLIHEYLGIIYYWWEGQI